ncbi:LOW QUALITY PROTEIN: growth arrest-specific protein 1-like [Rhipicephalus sanguineus]|uniref:LOW QUALITY PROTEIN: growth arrest-specific protein 1-like n=1 Tax=Rhipicephalus sanguineus TaxID=34632 RepID=UPI0020C53D0D|nr:LOW QUALITY PROTEIN: growth arrest-specific protein 1-like [Rhipicephalus sanguineus]
MSACHAAFSALLLLVAAVACGRSSSSATPPDNNEDAPLVRTCEEVQMRCAQRKGCGSALHAYLYQCNEVIQAGASQCPVPCQRALAALTSTDEGRGLSDCECGENDVCRKSKLRVEVCREAVEKLTAPGARIPCSVAFWMCEAEPQCGTALAYYYRYCRGAFHGKRCTPRCNNSLAILNRQPRSDTLRSCYCDGSEDFPCQKIRDRTDQLCYGRQEPSTTPKPGSAGTAVHPTGWPQLTLAVTLLLLVSFATRCGLCSVSDVT